MQWPGWRRDGGDGRTGPMATEVTAPTGLTSRRSPVRAWSSRSSSLRGLRRPFSRVRRVGRTGVGGIVPQGCCWPCRTAAGVVSPGESAEQCRGVIPRRGADLQMSEHQVPLSGSKYGGSRPVRSSSEAAFSSRSRLELARGGVQPPSEAESHPRGRLALERGGVLPSRHRAPRAKRSSARGWLGRLCGGPWAREFILRVFLGSFAFVFYEGKWVFPGCLGDPYGCPRQRRRAWRGAEARGRQGGPGGGTRTRPRARGGRDRAACSPCSRSRAGMRGGVLSGGAPPSGPPLAPSPAHRRPPLRPPPPAPARRPPAPTSARSSSPAATASPGSSLSCSYSRARRLSSLSCLSCSRARRPSSGRWRSRSGDRRLSLGSFPAALRNSPAARLQLLRQREGEAGHDRGAVVGPHGADGQRRPAASSPSSSKRRSSSWWRSMSLRQHAAGLLPPLAGALPGRLLPPPHRLGWRARRSWVRGPRATSAFPVSPRCP
jgi:hypothetical protein